MIDRERAPWWLWPNLLSLDAPLVALAWFWMFAKAWGVVSLPVSLPITMALAVWAIYAVDRVVDSRKSSPRASLERRHYFHRKYRWIFITVVIVVAIWSIYASLLVLSQTVLFYSFFVILLVTCYFALVIFQRSDQHTGLMKNALAGMTFSYGVAAGVHAYSPIVSFHQMVISQEVILFGGICILNMTAIDFWELEGEDGEDASALIGTGCLLLGGLAMFFSTQSDAFNRPFFYAVMIGSAGIYILNRCRSRLDQDGRRLWVDLVLLAPVGVYWLWITFYERNLA